MGGAHGIYPQSQYTVTPQLFPQAQLGTWAASSWLGLGLLTTVRVLFHHTLAFPEAWDAALFWETLLSVPGKTGPVRSQSPAPGKDCLVSSQVAGHFCHSGGSERAAAV